MKRIVTIHSVSERYYAPERLVRYIKTMRTLGWKFVPMDEILRPDCIGNVVCLTFDDAYKTCLTVALPILKEMRVPALIFVPTGLLGLEANNAQLLNHACYAGEPTMTAQDINAWLEEGQSIGFHTDKHLNLYVASQEEIYKDFCCGVEFMKKQGWRSSYFAYPFGFLPQHRADFEQLLMTNSFRYAFTINWGKVDIKNPFYINRVCLGNKENFWWSIAKTLGMADWYFRVKNMRKEQKI